MNFKLIRSTFRMLGNPTQRKHIFKWFNSFQKDFFLQKKQPWFAFDTTDFLNSIPLENKRVFEYGSGGSTLYWLSRNMKCVSVEHDPIWYDMVRIHINSALMEVDYRLIPPEESNQMALDIADPLLYLSEDHKFRGYSFKNYANQIDAFPHNYFDIVSIDGRARPACIMHAIMKVKMGGFLILDNSDRGYYLERTSALLRDYTLRTFRGATPSVPWDTETSVFTRRIS